MSGKNTHWHRSAVIGSTAVARLAGTTAASKATVASSSDMPMNRRQSVGVTPTGNASSAPPCYCWGWMGAVRARRWAKSSATQSTLPGDNAPCGANGTSTVVTPSVNTLVQPRSATCGRRPEHAHDEGMGIDRLCDVARRQPKVVRRERPAADLGADEFS